MTPQEKAEELVEKFRPYADRGIQDSKRNEIESAKQCALICVEEKRDMLSPYMGDMNARNYLNEVIKEIEKL